MESRRMKKIISIMMLMIISLSVHANDIYINQSGATLDLDITQDGQNNTVGSSSTASSVIGATTNLAITQVGDNNVMTFDVNGATYTGTYSVTGNSNNIDFNCDSGGTVSSCASVTASIIWVGSSNDLGIDVGVTADATGAVSPTSMSRSFEEPTQMIEAVTEAHELTVPPLSQLKSMLLLLPVVLKVPV
jgi:hypothetical protein